VAYRDDVYGSLDLTDRDTCFCWCFWSFNVDMADLKKCASLMVRAMDEGLSGQPGDMCKSLRSESRWDWPLTLHGIFVQTGTPHP
jgi:nitrate reductase (NAD(P)H)